MNNNIVIRFASILLVLLLGLGNLLPEALAGVSETLKSLGETAKIWEEQAAKHNNKPGPADCEYMRAQLEKARAELEQEKKNWQDAKNNPPKKENAEGGIAAGWAKYMSDWQKSLKAAEAELNELARRIDKLCPPPPPKKEDDKNDKKESESKGGPAKDSGKKEGGKGSGKKDSPESQKSGMTDPIRRVAFETAQGQVILTLPADMRAGDIISGTVDEENPARTGDALNGSVFEIGGKRYPVRNRVLTFVVPSEGSSSLAAALRDHTGKVLGKSRIEINRHVFPSNAPAAPLGNFQPPRVGQTGGDLSISGNFDGYAGSTRVFVGDQTAAFDAESPRATFFKLPANAPAGPSILTIVEDQELMDLVELELRQLLEDAGIPGRPAGETVREQFDFNTVSVALSADKLHLRRGESTMLHVTVRGLESADIELVELRLRSVSPAVRFDDSKDMLRMTIDPSEIQGGVFTRNERLTGIQPGAFTILATVVQDPSAPPSDRSGYLRWVAQVSSFRLETELQDLNRRKDWAMNPANPNPDPKVSEWLWTRIQAVMSELEKDGYTFSGGSMTRRDGEVVPVR